MGAFQFNNFCFKKFSFVVKLTSNIYRTVFTNTSLNIGWMLLNMLRYTLYVALCISLHQQPDHSAKGCLFGNLAIVRPLCRNDFTVYQTLRRCSTMSALASGSKAASKLGGSHQPVYPRMMLHGDLPGNLRVIRWFMNLPFQCTTLQNGELIKTKRDSPPLLWCVLCARLLNTLLNTLSRTSSHPTSFRASLKASPEHLRAPTLVSHSGLTREHDSLEPDFMIFVVKLSD